MSTSWPARQVAAALGATAKCVADADEHLIGLCLMDITRIPAEPDPTTAAAAVMAELAGLGPVFKGSYPHQERRDGECRFVRFAGFVVAGG
ncbi:hypothetical protein ACIOG7_18285, partial [Streptomyces sp. NPDC087894]|uniref:hypothetical protein n=1 Tax=Streptomyces sp. NPDC087894 TaxID=3365816 RepID=UPI0037F14912